MPWEQLDLPELEGRVMLVAGYLARRIMLGDVVLDLNCGVAPLFEYIGVPNGGRYIGNDTNPEFLRRLGKLLGGEWLSYPDDELPEFAAVNILVCLGYGARYHPLESGTIDGTILSLAATYRPRIVILGAWMSIAMLPRCGFSAMLGALEHCGYEIAQDWTIEANHATTPYSRRRIVMLERDPTLVEGNCGI